MMRTIKMLVVLVGLITGAILLASCGSQEEPAALPEPTPVPVENEVSTAEVEPAPDAGESGQEEATTSTNAIDVEDQTIGSGDSVTIRGVTSDSAGWVVIHAQADGKPGPILGKTHTAAGESSNLIIEIDTTGATETLYAMLHVDVGTPGEFEFPGGDDVPANGADGSLAMAPFSLTFPNHITVEDQALSQTGSVTIAEVISASPGWVVIHAQSEGKPGPILGAFPVNAGVNRGIEIDIDAAGATEVLYAMLHTDAGTIGEFEFPNGDDVPAVDTGGNVVTPPFTITGGLSSAVSVLLADSAELGTFLTDGEGMTLYTFANDEPGVSNCYDRCATAWPPFLVDEGSELTAGEGIPGELAIVERQDGTHMVTYRDWPLYYWVNDEAPGDTSGHNVNNVWAVAYPSTHVFLGGNEDLGKFLVGPDGMTLYRFNPDEPGVSSCYDSCAAAWPPLLVAEGEIPRGNAGVVGELGTTEREDGAIQVTYQGMPLYYWINDLEPGEATGQGVNDVWFVVPPYTVQVGRSEDLGDFLVDARGMTLYLFTVDEGGQSSCYDQCAVNWPPLLVQAGEIPVPGDGVAGDFTVSERQDGTLQVVYNGFPLYYWINDAAPGDTTGHGVNEIWFVVEP